MGIGHGQTDREWMNEFDLYALWFMMHLIDMPQSTLFDGILICNRQFSYLPLFLSHFCPAFLSIIPQPSVE
jgi:hypothetical protein